MSGFPLPTIDATRCMGCGHCVDLCPHHVLSLVNSQAVLTFPERCSYCLACEEQCPVGAIALPFAVVMAPPRHRRRVVNAVHHRGFLGGHGQDHAAGAAN
ncbi:MAG: 4Fe-4S binding protein [Caldilineaceae bacterium]|nr:4Fe-4S binding protein [Caldilineaceae bacterium]